MSFKMPKKHEKIASLEDEKEAFIADIATILKSIDQRICSVKDLSKAYREYKGQNVNVMIDKFSEYNRAGKVGNFWQFLNCCCKEYCHVFQKDGEYKVLRHLPECEDEPKKEEKNKKKAKKQAPKLNYGHPGIVNDATFPRRNPQGFAKCEAAENKQHKSPPTFKTTYSNVYRPAHQLKEFVTKDDDTESELSDYMFHKLELDDEEYESFDDDDKNSQRSLSPSDFPSLPANSSNEEQTSNNESMENQNIFANILKDLDKKVSPNVERKVYPVSRASPTFLDNPIFRWIYPDVVTDEKFEIPKMKMSNLQSKVVFEVNLITIHSPSQFLFQINNHALDSLISQLNSFYSEIPLDDLIISKPNLKNGLVVAAKYFGEWHRARVISQPQDNEEISLYFVDSGDKKLTPINEVRYLLEHFAKEPIKALRGSLAGIRQKENHNFAYHNQMFFNIVAMKELYATFRDYNDENDIYMIDLYSNNESIAEILINLGCADRDISFSKESFDPFSSYQQRNVI